MKRSMQNRHLSATRASGATPESGSSSPCLAVWQRSGGLDK